MARAAPLAPPPSPAAADEPQRLAQILEKTTAAALAVSSVEGPDAVAQLVLHLADILTVDAALVAVHLPDDRARMRTLAACLDGRMLKNFEYDIDHTPCRLVVGRDTRFVASGVHDEFRPGSLFHAKGFDAYAARVLTDANGQPIGLIVVMNRAPLCDSQLTELLLRIFAVRAAAEIERSRVRAEREASQASYRAIFDASEDGIFVHDIDTFAIVDVNPKTCAMYGYGREEMLRIEVGVISANVPPYTQVEAAQWLGRARAGEAVSFEWHARCRDGSLRWDEVKLKAATIGGKRRILAFVRDITERKAAEDALRIREEQYRAIFEASSDAFCLWDERLQTVDVNPAFLHLYGFERKNILKGSYPPDFPEEYVRERLALVRRALDGQSMHLETYALRADGSRFDVDLRVMPVRHRGEPHVLAIVRDITERRRAEERLRASEERYRLLFEMESDAIVLIDTETMQLLDVNRAACELYGYTRPELLGMRATDLSMDVAATRATISGENDASVTPLRLHRRRDGTVFPVEITTSRFRLDGREMFLAALRDITDRREREMALQRSEARLRATVEAAFDCVIGMASDGRVVEFNAAAERTFGLARESAIGQELSGLIIPARLRQAHNEGMVRFRRTGEGPYVGRLIETTAMRADGSEFPVELAISVAPGPDGDIFVGYLRDITERKRAEVHRARLEAQLRQAQKMEAFGQLTGGIAHDFNNILAGIMGYVVLATERPAADSDAKLLDHLEQALQSCRRARDLIQQMLAFSRGQRGAPQPVMLSALVDESTQILRSTLPSTMGLATEVVDAQACALIDPVQAQQVLLNLAINARDAMHGQGGIHIAVDRVRADAWVCASCRGPVDGEFVSLSVADSGPGVPAHIVERMFDPFFSTKEPGKGSGMGLAMVHGIVHDHGGHVLVESRPSGGAVFRVLLPQAAPGAGSRLPVPGRRMPAPPLRGHVLLVDDEAPVLDVTRELLQQWGLTVTATRDPLHARVLFEGDPARYDLVLTDQTMPGMTGLVLAGHLLAQRADLPVLVCSGYVDAIDSEQARAAGVRRVLSKPVEPKDLRQALQESLAAATSA